jgi:archaellum component FlaF (FlaF/FlaG flagellin family)
MYTIAIISLFISLLILYVASKSRLREVQTGHKLITHMTDVENPGYDWLGRWW